MDGVDGRDERQEAGDGIGNEEEAGAQAPLPWERDDYLPAGEEGGARQRHDAFTPERRRIFLRHLSRMGCILDACRKTGVSSRTIYNLQDKDSGFRRHCDLATEIAGSEVELTAWERGVKGVEQEVVCGGKVLTRVKYSDGLLRLLLIGSNRKKYGPHPGFKRKRILKWERERMEREIRAEIAAERPSFEEAMLLLNERLEACDIDVGIDEEEVRGRLEQGWTRTEEGHWIPPGWVRRDDQGGGGGGETPRDSM